MDKEEMKFYCRIVGIIVLGIIILVVSLTGIYQYKVIRLAELGFQETQSGFVFQKVK